MAHIHARGHGKMKTSEDYAELFDLVRESYGGKKFYCHFAGVEHRMGNALHYTQIKKSDLKFEPFAEYLAEEGEWLDITIISDSPLLEHDAMYMLQHYDKARQRLLEIRARDERQVKLARQVGMSAEEIAEFEKQVSAKKSAADQKEVDSKIPSKKVTPKKETASSMISFEETDDDDDIF